VRCSCDMFLVGKRGVQVVAITVLVTVLKTSVQVDLSLVGVEVYSN